MQLLSLEKEITVKETKDKQKGMECFFFVKKIKMFEDSLSHHNNQKTVILHISTLLLYFK